MTTTMASDTPFKAGETYRTRDGDAAGIDREDGREPYPLLGWIDDGDGKFTACWNRKGHWHGDRNARPGRNLLPPTPPAADDLAAARAEGWKAGAEAMKSAALQAVSAAPHYGVIYNLPLPSPPDAKPAVFDEHPDDVQRRIWSEGLGKPLPPAPERERLKGWVNVYPQSVALYDTRAAAHYGAGRYRTACIDLSQHFEGEGLEP